MYVYAGIELFTGMGDVLDTCVCEGCDGEREIEREIERERERGGV